MSDKTNMTNNKELTKFMYSFNLPSKDFTTQETQELTVKVVNKKLNAKSLNPSIGAFEITIPKYVKEFVEGKLKQYTKDGIGLQGNYDDGRPFFAEKYEFTNYLRAETLDALRSHVQQITNDAIHIKRFEDLEKHAKVLFVSSDYVNRPQTDLYNHGKMGNKVALDFQYFVAYKVKKPKGFINEWWQEGVENKEYVNEYYAIEQAPTLYGKKLLPHLSANAIKGFTQIPWTQEREDFFKEIETKIDIVSQKINSFVDEIKTGNIDKIIAQKRQLILEDKTGDADD